MSEATTRQPEVCFMCSCHCATYSDYMICKLDPKEWEKCKWINLRFMDTPEGAKEMKDYLDTRLAPTEGCPYLLEHMAVSYTSVEPKILRIQRHIDAI